MTSEIQFFILLAITTLASILGIVCLLFVFANKKNAAVQHKQLIEQAKRIEATAQQMQILRSEIAEVRAGLLSIGKRVVSCEQAQRDITQSISAQKFEDPDARIYSRAVKMIELGADIEEVMRECELPRAEAELLMTLHVKQK